MKYEEEARRAGRAGMPEAQFVDVMTDIHRGDAPSDLSDDELDGKAPVFPAGEPLSAEQATSRLKGAKYVQYLNSLIDRAQEKIAEAEEAISALMRERKQAVMARLSAWREKYADAKIGLIAALALSVLILATVLGEVHLLVLPLADWMGIEKMDKSSIFWLASAAAVVLGFLSLLAHEALDKTEPPVVRAVWGAGLLWSSLLIGYLRSSQADVEGFTKLVMYAWWSWVSFGAPMVTARFIGWFFPQLRKWLVFRADQYFHNGFLKYLEGEIEELRSAIEEATRRIEGIMQEFSENYNKLAFAAQRKVESARVFNRQSEASMARHLTVFWEELKSAGSPAPAIIKREPSIAPGIVALALLGILAFMVILAGVGHAEEAAQPVSVVVVGDRSGSSAGGLALNEKRLDAVFNPWAEKALARKGGSFGVLIVGSSIADVETFYSESVPETIRPPLSMNRRAWKKSAAARLHSAPLPDKGNASAIVEALFAATFRLSGVPGEKHVLLASDLRHIGGPFNFEQKVPTPAEFLKYLQSLPSQPDFRGISLTVCGFHTVSPGRARIEVQQFLLLRQVWSEAFKFWGLQDVPIVEECRF